ncbi:MAG: hypothetical protein IJT27_03930 [Clostridia bacterium]|nr:hypothetical protein [Clostridia bacterium]
MVTHNTAVMAETASAPDVASKRIKKIFSAIALVLLPELFFAGAYNLENTTGVIRDILSNILPHRYQYLIADFLFVSSFVWPFLALAVLVLVQIPLSLKRKDEDAVFHIIICLIFGLMFIFMGGGFGFLLYEVLHFFATMG